MTIRRFLACLCIAPAAVLGVASVVYLIWTEPVILVILAVFALAFVGGLLLTAEK